MWKTGVVSKVITAIAPPTERKKNWKFYDHYRAAEEERERERAGSRGWAAIIVCIFENVFFKNINLPPAHALHTLPSVFLSLTPLRILFDVGHDMDGEDN